MGLFILADMDTSPTTRYVATIDDDGLGSKSPASIESTLAMFRTNYVLNYNSAGDNHALRNTLRMVSQGISDPVARLLRLA
jgi:hypothetical protein